MNIVVVYNPKSGGGLTKDRLQNIFQTAGITVDVWVQLKGDLKQQLAPHAKSGQIIAVVGGDGSQRAVASLIVHTDATMAPLPGGTLNHFTKDLGVPQEIDEAIHRLPNISEKRIDVATVNDKVFVNNSSIGLYPRSLIEREKTEETLGKWPAAIRAAVSSLAHLRHYKLVINGKSIRTAFVFIGNNHYDIESSVIAQRHSLTEGVLTLFTLHSVSRLGMIKTALMKSLKVAEGTDDFSIDQPQKIMIESSRDKITVSLDGEVTDINTPLCYEVQPKSLKVLV